MSHVFLLHNILVFSRHALNMEYHHESYFNWIRRWEGKRKHVCLFLFYRIFFWNSGLQPKFSVWVWLKKISFLNKFSLNGRVHLDICDLKSIQGGISMANKFWKRNIMRCSPKRIIKCLFFQLSNAWKWIDVWYPIFRC